MVRYEQQNRACFCINRNTFRYTQLPCFDVAGVTSEMNEANKYGMLKSCSWKGVKLPCSKLFTTYPTYQGMCCTFNMKKADQMFKDSRYQKMVTFMQARDKNHSFERDKDIGDWIENPIPTAGRKKGLQLVIDAHSDLLSGGSVTEDFDGFYAIINSNDQFPTVTRNSVLIRAGHNNIVSMGATKVESDPKIKKVDYNKRYCLFPDEKKLYVHKEYSQANCLLECGMQYAVSIIIYRACQ